jgi:hypothetical protein
MRVVLVSLVLLAGVAVAQGFAGTFSGESGAGPIEVELRQAGTTLTGSLVGATVRFELEGTVDGDMAYGAASTAVGAVGFEAYLQGDTLGLYLFEVDPQGAPIHESVIELILARSSAASPGGAAPPAAGGARDPFGAAPGPRDPFAAPAAPDPLLGVFADERISLEVRSIVGGYEAEVRANEQVFALQLVPTAEGLAGSFRNGAETFAFTARLEGDVMLFVTSGTTYRLARRTPAARDPFGAAPATPGRASAPEPDRGAALARAGAVVLYEADAVAFLDMLEFVLDQLGYPYRFSSSERGDAVREIARTFPGAGDDDRVVLANAREIWGRVAPAWSRIDDRERREFALGVLLVAFGRETVEGWLAAAGPGAGGQGLGGGRSCGSFEECTSRFVDERTWTDTSAAQGCWAAAGCESYDSSTGTLTFNDD